MTVDPRAVSGFAHTAGAYERGRPSYPPEAVSDVVRALGVGPASAVLDLAAGTGKLTRVLAPLVGRIVAVDPSAAMLAELRARLPEVDSRTGSAEAIPLAAESVDAVFVAEAFHWFGSASACGEIARVLRAGGGLAALWNRSRWDELEWHPTFETLLTPVREAAGAFPADGDRWQRALRETGRFGPLSRADAEWTQTLGVDEFVDRIASISWIANLPDLERTAVLDEVRALVDPHAPLRLPYRTEVHWCRLR